MVFFLIFYQNFFQLASEFTSIFSTFNFPWRETTELKDTVGGGIKNNNFFFFFRLIHVIHGSIVLEEIMNDLFPFPLYPLMILQSSIIPPVLFYCLFLSLGDLV